jgi:hypothetical protein
VNYRSDLANRNGRSIPTNAWDGSTLRQDVFHRMIALERRRVLRSRRTIVLMLVDLGEQFSHDKRPNYFQKLISAIAKITRETDVTGWYKEPSVLGIMLTDVEPGEQSTITTAITRRLMRALQQYLSAEQQRTLNISFEFISEASEQNPTVRRAAASAADAPVPAARAVQGGRKWAL